MGRHTTLPDDTLPGSCGIVRAGTVETEYRRAGAGAPALLLDSHGLADPWAVVLFRTLATCCRVTAPCRLPACTMHTTSLCSWLNGLLDGLGLERVSIIADAALCSGALAFALAEPDRIDRIVLLHRDTAEHAAAALYEDALRGTGHPLLVVHTGASMTAAAEAVAAFVAASAMSTGAVRS